jgi:hypothetical protein
VSTSILKVLEPLRPLNVTSRKPTADPWIGGC